MATPNQTSYWYTGQVVTAVQMNDFSQDYYARFTAITENPIGTTGAILTGATTTQGSGNVMVTAGSFRFVDTTYAFLPYDTGIFGNADAATVSVSGNGYIVARYVVNPTSMDETNYTFATTYLFVATMNPVTDCLICAITAGVISGFGNYLINSAATNSNVASNTGFNAALTPGSMAYVQTVGGGTIGAPTYVVTYNTAIGGDIPSAQNYTEVSGAYTENGIYNSNGINGNKGVMSASYMDGGNGTFKPYLLQIVTTPDGYEAATQYSPAGSSTTYQGFVTESYNISSNATAIYSQMYPDINNNANSLWVAFDSVAITGLAIYNDGTQWMRPEAYPTVAGLGTTADSLAVLGDMGILATVVRSISNGGATASFDGNLTTIQMGPTQQLLIFTGTLEATSLGSAGPITINVTDYDGTIICTDNGYNPVLVSATIGADTLFSCNLEWGIGASTNTITTSTAVNGASATGLTLILIRTL